MGFVTKLEGISSISLHGQSYSVELDEDLGKERIEIVQRIELLVVPAAGRH